MSLPKKLHLSDTAGTSDPCRRLVAAVVMHAVMDFLHPKPSTPFYDRYTAREFCRSQSGQELIEDLAGISPVKIKEIFG